MRIFAPSRQVSAKNQAAHTKLKFRQEGQAAPHELKNQDLKAKLEAKEKKHFQKAKGISFEEERKKDLELLESAPPDEGGGGGGGSGRALMPHAKDADDVDADADDDDSDESDSDDDEAELKAELERIRAERAAEAERRAAEEEAKRQEAIRAEVLGGNPLLPTGDVDFGLKRRWDEDVVFKNQTRGEVKAPRRFINDTVRSDFHRKFLERYIR